MNEQDCKKVELMAELKVRQYFDHFLTNVFPEMLQTHIAGCPHGKKVSRLKWTVVGIVIGLAVAVPTVGKPLLHMITTIP
jgi:hypothetical protein